MPLNLALLKGCDIRGVFWGAWTRLNVEKNRANLEKLVKWTAEGKISSHVDRTFPLAQTAEALKVLAGRKAMGKVILHPDAAAAESHFRPAASQPLISEGNCKTAEVRTARTAAATLTPCHCCNHFSRRTALS
jgi:hypothetical protein